MHGAKFAVEWAAFCGLNKIQEVSFSGKWRPIGHGSRREIGELLRSVKPLQLAIFGILQDRMPNLFSLTNDNAITV